MPTQRPARRFQPECLKFDRKDFPPPDDFVLFAGGERDFATFSAGVFEHVIFNVGLQEGWDDPSCCLAYIDKSMGSTLQVEQVIGRVLRQPGGKHYPHAALNAAHFYIRYDDKQEFPRILERVRRQIAADVPDIKLSSYTSSTKGKAKVALEPKEPFEVPEIHLSADPTLTHLHALMKSLPDFRKDVVNTVGTGERLRAIQPVGTSAKASVTAEELPHANRVTARWICRRAVQSAYPEAAKTIDWSHPFFDARVEVSSVAAQTLREFGEKVVNTFLEYCDLTFEKENVFSFGPVFLPGGKLVKFDNAIHEGYGDLRGDEEDFAHALDKTGVTWVRNPANGGYAVPLLDKGDTRHFYPDFLSKKGKLIFALDPKGEHLIHKDSGRKLLSIRDENDHRVVIVRLITKGQWQPEPVKRVGPNGYGVWSLGKTGKIQVKNCTDVDAAVKLALSNG